MNVRVLRAFHTTDMMTEDNILKLNRFLSRMCASAYTFEAVFTKKKSSHINIYVLAGKFKEKKIKRHCIYRRMVCCFS